MCLDHTSTTVYYTRDVSICRFWRPSRILLYWFYFFLWGTLTNVDDDYVNQKKDVTGEIW
jgi:hypothetical protein